MTSILSQLKTPETNSTIMADFHDSKLAVEFLEAAQGVSPTEITKYLHTNAPIANLLVFVSL